MPYRLILSTADSQPEARKLAHALIEKKLAACVNIIPQIESIYRWQGKVESAQEWLLVVKTTARRAKAVERAIKELHSYDVPECIVVNIEGGSPEYLQWLEAQVRPGN
jgi:periplasmic divalent cation tolerance protein